MQKVNCDHLHLLNKEAATNGKEIKSFHFDEISIVPGGGLEMGPISNVVYTDGTKRDDLIHDPASLAFLGHELNHK